MKTMEHATLAGLAAVILSSSLSVPGQSGPKIASPSTPRPLHDVVDQVDRSVVRVVAEIRRTGPDAGRNHPNRRLDRYRNWIHSRWASKNRNRRSHCEPGNESNWF